MSVSLISGLNKKDTTHKVESGREQSDENKNCQSVT